MKSYLNKKEREDYCVVALVAGKLEEMFTSWSNNLSPAEHRALSMAKTYIFKFMDSIQARMDKDFTKQLMRDLRSSEILVLPKFEAQREFEKRKLDDGFVQISKETILNLAENALYGCEDCTKDYKQCDLRQTFMALEIEPFDYTAKDKCQYKITYDAQTI